MFNHRSDYPDCLEVRCCQQQKAFYKLIISINCTTHRPNESSVSV
jgi:hypothetical protein